MSIYFLEVKIQQVAFCRTNQQVKNYSKVFLKKITFFKVIIIRPETK